MKTIALYVVVGLCRIIFITADEQGDGECNHITYVQILPTYAVVFFFLQLQMLIEGSLGFFLFRFLSTCCSDDHDSIHNDDTFKKICKGVYAFSIDISLRDKYIQYNAIFYIKFRIKKPEIFGYITICFVVACIGHLCRPKCPQGYYGEHCNETCSCDAEACDDVLGCVTTGK